jgi:gliding motility-associated-like protein
MRPLTRACLLPIGLCLVSLAAAQEICNNGIDDDGNGLIDLNDPACACNAVVVPPGVESYVRNHSFEEQSCCPYTFVSQASPPWLSCATGWVQATSATSDYFHMCGYAPVGFNLPPPDGEGAVGFFAGPGYYEYVGTCLTYPAPANPLLAGVTYTLSLWISAAAVNNTHSQPLALADPSPFTDQLPLAIFGHANACVPMPVGTADCIGFLPGWQELGRVMVQPAWEWVRVAITFTPTEDMHAIMIGGGCDSPASFNGTTIYDANGVPHDMFPYFLVDDLMLTIAQDQVLCPVVVNGSLCRGDLQVVAAPPPGSTDHQWYLDGVALPGQNGLVLDLAQAGLGAGAYAFTCTVAGECLMGMTQVVPEPPPVPAPVLATAEGCVPLTVAFDHGTSNAAGVQWDLGDGTLTTQNALVHTYTVPGTYDVRLTVQGNNGCVADTLLAQAVVVHPHPGGAITVSPDPVDANDPVAVLAVQGAAQGTAAWLWDLGVAMPATATGPSVGATFPTTPGSYPVTVVVTTVHGCTDTLWAVVNVVDPGTIEMPTVFSPNGDGINDTFAPIDYKGAPGELFIYNRWGQEVFRTRALERGWSGKDAPDGTYYYIVVPDPPNQVEISGHVTLLR